MEGEGERDGGGRERGIDGGDLACGHVITIRVGLVLGLGNRLWPKGGVASQSCDNHVTGGGGNIPKRRTSMKRHSSADDLLCHEGSKRR